MNENPRFQRSAWETGSPPPSLTPARALSLRLLHLKKWRCDGAYELSPALLVTDLKGSPVSAGSNLCSCLRSCQTALRNAENPVWTGKDRTRHNSFRRWLKKTQHNPINSDFTEITLEMKLGGESAKLQITMMIVFTIRNTNIHFFPVRLSEDAGATRKRDKNAPCLRIVPNAWTHTPQRVPWITPVSR